MIEFMTWFFSLKMDAIVGPWVKDNAMTIGFFLGFPYLAYRCWWRNMQQIKALKKEQENEES